MKFPSLSSSLKLLKPFAKKNDIALPKQNVEMTLYDKIEEIISIADTHANSLEIAMKFYNLNDIQQRITVVTLIEHNMVATLEVVLLSDFDVNFLIRGLAPIHYAIKDQNLPMIRLLIKYQADLEFKDAYHETALNFAVRIGNTKVIELLLEQGADVNTQASDSSTPLEFALHQGDVQSVNLLEKHGALLGNSYLVKNL